MTTENLDTEPRVTDLPTTDLPTTDLRTTDLPTTDLPTTDLPTTDLPTTGTVTIFTTTWCGYCRRLKAQMDDAGIAYREVDVEEHPEAADFVEHVNGGNRTVPTVLFPDGTAATNPSLREVTERLGA